jgi:hypothetical protein
VVVAADFAFSRGITWSAIPLTGMAFLWMSATSIILSGRRIQLVLILETISLLLLLALVDTVTTGRPWFLFPAAPLTLLLGILTSLIVALSRAARLSTLSTIAIALLAAGLMAIAVEASVTYFLADAAIVSWSMLSGACILPPVLMLLYLQRRLRRSGPEIRKRFHL